MANAGVDALRTFLICRDEGPLLDIDEEVKHARIFSHDLSRHSPQDDLPFRLPRAQTPHTHTHTNTHTNDATVSVSSSGMQNVLLHVFILSTSSLVRTLVEFFITVNVTSEPCSQI